MSYSKVAKPTSSWAAVPANAPDIITPSGGFDRVLFDSENFDTITNVVTNIFNPVARPSSNWTKQPTP